MKGTIKTPGDTELLRESGTRLARVVAEVAGMVRPGVLVEELDRRAEELIRAGGDEPAFLGYQPHGAARPYPASMCVSVNEEVVHGIPSEEEQRIADGDIVSLDCGLTHNGLISDHAVSVIAGENPSSEDRLLVEHTHEALMAGIKAARGGAHIGDIGAAIEAVGRAHGYGIVHALGGHGVGYAVHEEPYVPNFGMKGTGPELVPGMVLAIEPMFTKGSAEVELMPDGYTYVTKDGSRAAHFEHTILITDGDAEILTAI